MAQLASKIEFACNDVASLLAPIFTHIGHFEGERPKDTVYYRYNGVDITFRMFWRLDVIEQSILFGIVGLASLEKLSLPDTPPPGTTSFVLSNRLEREATGEHCYSTPLGIKTSYSALLKASGLGRSAQSVKRLKDAIKRLCNVTYTVENDRYCVSEKMISVVENKETEEVFVALSSILAYALDAQFAYVDLVERRSLGSRTGIAHLLHARLSASLNPGKTHSFNADRMAHMLAGKVRRNEKNREKEEVEALPGSELANMRRQVVSAFKKIGTLPGWKIDSKGKGSGLVYRVTRPKIQSRA